MGFFATPPVVDDDKVGTVAEVETMVNRAYVLARECTPHLGDLLKAVREFEATKGILSGLTGSDPQYSRDRNHSAGAISLAAPEPELSIEAHPGPRDDRADNQLRQVDLQEASALWQALVAGRWSLISHFDTSGHRCFLAKKNDPDIRAVPALSERERQIAAYASLGHSNKLIAYELGLCSSTIAAQLTSAARKLGVSSRKTLLHAFAVLGNGIPEQGPLSAGSVPPAQPHDHDPVVRVTRFLCDEREFALIKISITPKLPASLTAAEREVTTLIIKGLSNAAIAERRNTSVRTVANQLRSIYAKLAVGSRRELCSHFSIQ